MTERPIPLQATVVAFDPGDRSGLLVTDTGEQLAFDGVAFAASGLLLLRPGQRVRYVTDRDGRITVVTVWTLGRQADGQPGVD